MSERRSVWQVIPTAGRVIAVLVYVCLAMVLWQAAINVDPKMRQWPAVGKILFAAGIPIVAAGIVLLWSYIYGDAKRRGMRAIVWLLLAMFVPNMVGVILYFLFRDPIVSECPACGGAARETFTYCPKCGAVLAPACPQCHRTIQTVWANCAWCGAKLGTPPPTAVAR